LNSEPPSPNGEHPQPNGDVPRPDLPPLPPEILDEDYEPGETLSRGMNIACSLVLLFFALLSCGFIASVLGSRH